MVHWQVLRLAGGEVSLTTGYASGPSTDVTKKTHMVNLKWSFNGLKLPIGSICVVNS